ncbi:MAG TPA: NAD(P)-binding protein [Bacteroidia bacterium]|jgi:predicted NAD/FAD-binding protein
MRIAIIGAGVSGLTTAYYLKKNPATMDAEIVIYEKSDNVGGNADTINVLVPTSDGPPLERWVDMGVNDFNLATYTPLIELWQDLGIMNNQQPCPVASDYCSPLIDTESFMLPGPDNSYQYRYWVGAGDAITVPPTSIANADLLYNGIKTFQADLAAWYNEYQTEGANEITIGDWLLTKNYSDEFITKNLFPRINGMYFTREYSEGHVPPPHSMPLWMVAHYYILQEAYGQPASPCTRQYFVGGSRKWLLLLAEKLVEMNVTINLNSNINSVSKITMSEKISKMIVTADGAEEFFDKVVFATHADDTYNMIDETFKSDEMVQALNSFTFSPTTVYVHQDASFLGPRDCDQTYNIHIYDYSDATPTTRYPYTISYIVNKHQNDPANPDPRIQNCPYFYITISPFWAPQPANILLLADQPQTQAITQLWHANMDNNSVNAQVLIDQIQLEVKKERSYYFAGSFARGAGLHMECIIHAQELANKIADPNYTPVQTYKFGSKDRHFAPKYIMDAISNLKK